MNKIQRYLRCRQSLIEQYVRGDMTKAEYLERNMEAVLSLNIEPFTHIDTVEKGLFNYQYYNAMAKEAQMQPQDAYHKRNAADEYYRMKDKATASILRLVDYTHVEAYFIKARSKYLKGKLFEILLLDYHTILHSKSTYILSSLRHAGVFSEGTRVSLIDSYINQRY